MIPLKQIRFLATHSDTKNRSHGPFKIEFLRALSCSVGKKNTFTFFFVCLFVFVVDQSQKNQTCWQRFMPNKCPTLKRRKRHRKEKAKGEMNR